MASSETVPQTGTLDGFAPDEVAEYLDEIYADLRLGSRIRAVHDRDGYLAEDAGSYRCLKLGHYPDPALGWDDDGENHPTGWNGDPLCFETRYGQACTECESEDCEGASYLAMSTRDEFWALVAG